MTTHTESSDIAPPRQQTRISFEVARVSRLAAIQALFQIRTSGTSSVQVIQEFIRFRFQGDDYPFQPDETFFKALIVKVLERSEELTSLIDGNLKEPWCLERLEPVLREIVMAGALELLEPVGKVPAPVIIGEYIDLTRGFLGNTEANLVNGVLDSIARSLGLPLKKS